jgi:hypothetical protein
MQVENPLLSSLDCQASRLLALESISRKSKALKIDATCDMRLFLKKYIIQDGGCKGKGKGQGWDGGANFCPKKKRYFVTCVLGFLYIESERLRALIQKGGRGDNNPPDNARGNISPGGCFFQGGLFFVSTFFIVLVKRSLSVRGTQKRAPPPPLLDFFGCVFGRFLRKGTQSPSSTCCSPGSSGARE